MKIPGRLPEGRKPFAALIAVVLAAAVAISGAAIVQSSGTNHVTAYFRNTAGLYTGDRVMLLGVPVGAIDTITPEGDQVRVEMSYDNSHPVPADAGAVIVAPTLVTGRYVQLAPVYRGGPVLADGAVIGIERTASPIEFDEVKRQVVALTQDVGSTPENPDGVLADFVSTTADTVEGSGQALHSSLTSLSAAVKTLNMGGEDIFAAVENLQVVTSALAENDRQIVGFSAELADLSRFLNGNRTELEALLSSVETTFAEATSFVADNRDLLTNDVGKLNTLTTLLVDRQDTLASILHYSPTALSNFYNIYDSPANSLTGALAIADYPDPRSLICALLTTVDAPDDECGRASTALAQGMANLPGSDGPR